MYYDRQGNTISEEAWEAHWSDVEYRVLARTDLGEWTVAAWWTGQDEAPADGRPKVFRSALLSKPRQGSDFSPLLGEWRHRSLDDAVRHHDELVARMQGDAFGGVQAEQAPSESHCCHASE